MVAVHDKTARAGMHPHFYPLRNDSSTTTASLRCIFCYDWHCLTTACYRFVGQELAECVPSSISNGTRIFPGLHHLLDGEVLEEERAVLRRQGIGGLVQEVNAAVADVVVDAGDAKACFLAVPAALLLPRQASLRLAQLRKGMVEMPWVLNPLTIGERCEMRQTNINTDRQCRSNGLFLFWDVTSKHGKPLICGIALDGHRLDFALHHPMQDNGDGSDLADLKTSLSCELEAGLRVSDALHSRLEPRESCLDFLASFLLLDPTEEVLQCLHNAVADILQDL